MAWRRTVAPQRDPKVGRLNFEQLVAAVAADRARQRATERRWELPKFERDRDRRASKLALLRLRVRLFELAEADAALAGRLENAPSGPDRQAGPVQRAERWLAGCYTHARKFGLDPRAELADAEEEEERANAIQRRQEP